MNNELFNNLINVLKDLEKRLQDNYNGSEFVQYEEDRLAVYNAVERLEKIKSFVDKELSTYPCNETLETIQNYIVGDFNE